MAKAPQSFRDDFTSLNGVEPLTLLKLQIQHPDGLTVFRFCLQKSISWAGQSWALTPFSLTGEGDRAGGEQVRPTLVLPNPEGLFSYYVTGGWLDRARVTKHLVHPDDLALPHSIISNWYVSRFSELNSQAISLELSALSDGNSFRLPARRFIQPEFGLVRL